MFDLTLVSPYNNSKILFFFQFHQNYFLDIIFSNGIIIIFNINEHISLTFKTHVLDKVSLFSKKMQIRKANIFWIG